MQMLSAKTAAARTSGCAPSSSFDSSASASLLICAQKQACLSCHWVRLQAWRPLA